MKNTSLLFGIAIIALGFTSCKDEKETLAEKKIDNYVNYVDSVKNVSSDKLEKDWQTIENQYEIKANEAKMALADLKDNNAAQVRINESATKYDVIRTDVVAVTVETYNQERRDKLFGKGNLNKDMSFAWVNAQNILSVYEHFVNTVAENQKTYSREDWDEIKLMYEALDSRKNTVEKEGLSSSDNLKIAGLKIKFGPMYTLNRMGAKSEENAKAKEE